MKDEKLWKCDLCGHESDDQDEIEECMKFHRENGDFDRERERERLEEELRDLDRW